MESNDGAWLRTARRSGGVHVNDEPRSLRQRCSLQGRRACGRTVLLGGLETRESEGVSSHLPPAAREPPVGQERVDVVVDIRTSTALIFRPSPSTPERRTIPFQLHHMIWLSGTNDINPFEQ